MKKTLILCFTALITHLAMAQDACTDLARFNNNAQKPERTYRMHSKTEGIGQEMTIERDKKGHYRQTMSMDMMGQSMKMESIILGNMMYVKQNDAAWQPRSLDTAQIAAMKKQMENNQLQFLKNCQKLPNENIDGKNYRVYAADFDGQKMFDEMSKSKEPIPNAEAFKSMEMKMTFYINDKDDIAIAKLSIQAMGRTINSNMDYEYDITVNDITPPPPPPVSKD